MNKNLQDISEVSSATELIARCDGMRKDGTCGNGYNVENHDKPCVGKKCPYRFGYYYHKTGGGYCQPCSVLPKHVDSTKAAVETAIAVVGASTYQQRVSDQYATIETAKDNLLRECVKFGALLTEVGYFLGEARHAKNEGEGLKTWLEENCPEVNYSTAMGYKALATKCVKMLGGGSQAVAVLQDKTEVVPPGENEPIEVDSKFLEKRDELFAEVKSRRELEQTYFKFMASEGRRGPGRPKGTTKPVPENYAAAHKTNAENAATAYAILWRELDKKRQLPNLASLLSIEDARSIHELVKPVFEALRKRVGEAE